MTDELLVVPISRPDDVFILRQRARQAAAAAGFEEVDQVRVATALSELGREVLTDAPVGRARARTRADPPARAGFSLVDRNTVLAVTISGLAGDGPESARFAPALAAAARLVDEVVVEEATADRAAAVVLRKRLPVGRATSADALRAALAAAPASPLEELRAQNLDLIATLDELTARRDELLSLNEELEETNRGVMAMYGQLSDELAETNRGVVALYAELDEKSDELARASEAKSRFLANVSHELRSPVNSIIGLTSLLSDAETPFADAEQRRQVELISRSAGELLILVNGLLDLARAESGRLEPEVGRVDLREVVSEMRGTLRPLVPADVTLAVDLADDLDLIETDRGLLLHVVRNLLTNALAFTERGSVRLTARMLSPVEIAVEVADTGIGIAPDDQERVFEEFFQVKGPLQTRRKGTGLGLPYARRVVHALGGTLTLRSEPGEGSTFTITLPTRWIEPLTRAASRAGPAPADVDVQVAVAMIIDDDPGFRRILRGMLQGMVGQVIEATSGQDALDQLQGVTPDIVFLDLRMPDMDGAEVLSHMERLPVRATPVVIVSSVDLSGPAFAGLGRSAATLAKASLDRATLRTTLAAVLASDPEP